MKKMAKFSYEAGHEIDEEFIAFLNQNVVSKIHTFLKLDNVRYWFLYKKYASVRQSKI